MSIPPDEYTRLMEAARLRAHALRRDASRQFWEAAGALAMKCWSRLRAALAGHPRQLEA